MKKIISNIEMYLGNILLISPMFIIGMVIRSEIIVLLSVLAYLIVLIRFIVYKLTAGKGLPSKCKRNSQGFIEMHVENDCDNKLENLLSILCEVIEIGKNEKKDILIDSWLISRKNIIRYLGNSVEFTSFSLIQRISNKIHRFMYKGKRRNNIEPYRCIIKTSLVTKDQIMQIQNKITQIDSRSKRIG